MIGLFINWMKTYDTIHPVSEQTYVPKMLRAEVWRTYNGSSIKGPCYCCKKELDALETWHPGYVIPSEYGGKLILDNLRPICIPCNHSMGTENMYVYKARTFPSKL
jgi:5-methylcytosine-specific restriction endonuclease McrA